MAAMGEPVLSGVITSAGMLSVLEAIERRRTTGVLEFQAGDVRGEVWLIGGQIALDQVELSDGRDPVEVLLELREGDYRVVRRLPPLPVSQGDDSSRTGSLAVHVPADLMRYCEQACMTGRLALENDGRLAEVVYDSGELVAIHVEGHDEEDLNEVFGWEEGTFHIEALSKPPPPPIPAPASEEQADGGASAVAAPAVRGDATGQHFLHTVEVALTKIVEERERRRSPTRTGPALPDTARPRASESVAGVSPAKEQRILAKQRDSTVRIVYLAVRERRCQADEGLRHIGRDVTAEVVLTDAAPERRGSRSHRAGDGGAGAPTLPGTLAWVVAVLVLLVAALGALAWLPPIE
jgi:hypothetical protein